MEDSPVKETPAKTRIEAGYYGMFCNPSIWEKKQKGQEGIQS